MTHCTRFGQNCIVGNFRGRKLLQISQFCESFLCKIWGRCFFWCGKSEQATKVFSTKIIFFTNSHKFSPSKVSLYTVPCLITCASVGGSFPNPTSSALFTRSGVCVASRCFVSVLCPLILHCFVCVHGNFFTQPARVRRSSVQSVSQLDIKKKLENHSNR